VAVDFSTLISANDLIAFIVELLEAMKGTDALTNDEKMRLERKQEALKKQEKEDRENAKKAEEELKELEVEEKKLRDKVYSDAEEAKSAQCLMETSTSGSGLGDGNGNGTTDIPQGSNDIPDGSLDLSEDLDLLKRTLPLQRQSLAKIAVKNKEAKPGVKLFKSFVKSVNKWTEDGKFARLGEKDIEKVLKFTKDVKNERDRVSQINNEETINVSLNSDDVSVAKVAKSTDEYLTTKIKKIKKNAKYQLLSNRMMEALEELANTKIDIEDKEQIIDYLDKCLGYLNKLREAWGEIKDFFVNVKEMGRTVKTRAGMIKEHMDILTSYEVSHVKIIMDDIEKDSVQAFSKNLYIIEVSSFYRNIMQKGGLLKKIRALNFGRCSEENCVQNIQQYILDDAKVTGRSISKQIGFEQAKLDKTLRREINEISNHIACNFKKDPRLMENPEDFQILQRIKDKEKQLEQASETAKTIKPVTTDAVPVITCEDKDNFEVEDDDFGMFDF